MSDPSSSWPVALKREIQVENYTLERLQQSLDYAERMLRRRDITPRLESFMRQVKQGVRDAMDARTDEHRLAYLFAGVVQCLEYVMEIDSFVLRKPPHNIQQMQAEILALRQTQYFSRYGDSFRTVSDQLRSCGAHEIIQEWHLPSHEHTWAALGRTLDGKAPNDLGKLQQSQLRSQIVEACHLLGIDFELTERSFIEYGKRNVVAYHDLESLKSCGAFPRLAQMLWNDYEEVHLTFWELRSDVDSKSLKNIIKKEIERCFIKSFSPSDYRGWEPTQELRDFQKRAQNRSPEPSFEELPEDYIVVEMQTNLEKLEMDEPGDSCQTNKDTRNDLLLERKRLLLRIEQIDADLAEGKGKGEAAEEDNSSSEEASEEASEDFSEESSEEDCEEFSEEASEESSDLFSDFGEIF